mgnify:CR=1 FL=1|tara:strand:- start:8017 stop:8757 length:741 start_codon:yes stop_codon:yes gene_type:complete
MKRIFDICFSLFGLILTLPIIVPVLIIVWLKDKSNPFYISKRVGENGNLFKLIKIRTMVINADISGVNSTSLNDPRITSIGLIIRKYKIDELPQLINILKGEMSLVGPRPNVKRETDLYTKIESQLLKIKPGLTDFASIVFSDESEILAGSKDPDLTYNQLIRPLKSRLGLFYIYQNNLLVDISLIFITLINSISRKKSLKMINRLLKNLNASQELIEAASRKSKLIPSPPPGSDMITKSRNNNFK